MEDGEGSPIPTEWTLAAGNSVDRHASNLPLSIEPRFRNVQLRVATDTETSVVDSGDTGTHGSEADSAVVGADSGGDRYL